MAAGAESQIIPFANAIKGQRKIVENRASLYFYQNSQLATVVAARGNQHILRFQDAPVALLGQAKSAIFLKADEAHTILGHQTDAMAYTPYGYLGVARPEATLRFTGHYYDFLTEGYLLGNGHRLFRPLLMRFCSPDAFSPFSQGGPNAYGYCSNDPLNRVDPSGNASVSLKQKLVQGLVERLVERIIGKPRLPEQHRVNSSASLGESGMPSQGTSQSSGQRGASYTLLHGREIAEQIANQLSGKDLGALASVSPEFNLRFRAISKTNAKKVPPSRLGEAARGDVNGVIPFDVKDVRAAQRKPDIDRERIDRIERFGRPGGPRGPSIFNTPSFTCSLIRNSR